MKRIVLILAALACGLAVRAPGAVLTDPAQIMNEAYISLVQGDQSLDAGRLDEARALYVQARAHYQRLAQDFPGFEPRIIQYRRTYCDNQLAAIERRREMAAAPSAPPLAEPLRAPSLPPALPPAVAPAVASAGGAPASAPTGDRSVEVDYLKSRVASLEAELAELDAMQEEIDELVLANDRLTRQVEEANRQLEAASRELAARSAAGPDAAAELRAELSAKDRQIQELTRELEGKRELDQALNDMEAAYNEARAMADRLGEEIQALDAELDDAEVRASQAEFRAQQAEAQLAAARSAPIAPPPAAAPAAAVAAAKPPPAAPPAPPVAEPARAEPKPRKEAKPAAAPAPTSAAAVAVAAPIVYEPLPIPAGMTAADFIRRLLQQGENGPALATVQHARRSAPEDMTLALIEGIALIRLQRHAEAATLLIEVARRNPRNPEVNAALGAAMMGAGFYDEARETLQLALRLDKHLPECHYNLAQLYAFVEPINVRLARRHYRNARDLGLAADPQLERALR